jgi:hypothetical protein
MRQSTNNNSLVDYTVERNATIIGYNAKSSSISNNNVYLLNVLN